MQQIVTLVHGAVAAAAAAAASKDSDDRTSANDTDLHASTDRLVRKTLAKDDRVYAALERQLRMFLLQELCRDETYAQLSRRLDAHKLAINDQLKRFGLDVVSHGVCDLLARLNRLGSFNWQVCSVWYSKVLSLE
ncbi:hypothetical protein GGI22_006287 [Coemansia erecta]|nr:hypothetical protein GGI22_006287 [Coemansia erecta]